MFLYLILIVLSLIILFHFFLKLKFRFWSRQPVFHLHNLYYWVWPPGLVQHAQPPITRFYDYTITCEPFQNIPTEKKALLYFIIRNHFLYNKKAHYHPPKKGVFEYFACHDRPSYISLQYNSAHTTLISCMTSRPLVCYLAGQTCNISYVDFLCVHTKHRKKGAAPKQIYTHYYKSREQGAAPIFLFKREGEMNLMVPLTIYYAYVFSAKKWKQPNFRISNTITCHLITETNVELIFHYFDEIKTAFACTILPCFSHIKNLITHQLLLPCLLMEQEKPIGIYFYRYPYTSYNRKKSIECLASYVTPGYEQLFTDSFQNTITLLQSKVSFELIVIENISNNNIIIRNIMKKYIPEWKCPMAYYFYNFIYRPIMSTKVFIIN